MHLDLLDFGLPPLSDYMPEAVYRAALARARRFSYSDGQAMHARGDEGPRLCIIARGAVRVGRFRRDGSFNLLSTLGPGAHYGDVGLHRQSSTHNAYAVGACEIDVIQSPTLGDLIERNAAFAAGLWRCATARLNAILELYDDARTLPVTVRLAKAIHVHYGRGALADGLACVQRDLAELLGVSQVSIGTALKELEIAGLVEPGYRRVRVPDRERLRAWLTRMGAI